MQVQECNYNDFKLRFVSQNEVSEFAFLKFYDFALFEYGMFDRAIVFGKSKNQVVFNANSYMNELGRCKKYIVVKNNTQLNLLWTSLPGEPEIYNLRGGKKELFDYLFLTFTKKKSKCLYIGDSPEAPLAAWRNEVNCDTIYTEVKIIDTFLKSTVEQFLPF
jgi:hypothetical protein